MVRIRPRLADVGSKQACSRYIIKVCWKVSQNSKIPRWYKPEVPYEFKREYNGPFTSWPLFCYSELLER